MVFFCWVLGCSVFAQESPIRPDEGLPHVIWSDAEKVVGSVAVVSGKLVDVASFGNVNFLNFDANRRDVFKVVIFKTDLAQFPDDWADRYDQKLVSVRGAVTLYKNVPQIRVTSPDQIRIVRRLPRTVLPRSRKYKVGKQVRLATFNTRNLFDAVDDPYYADEATKPKPRDELEKLATAIRRIDADVLALQEVESRGYLGRFVDALLGDLDYEVVHYAGNDQRGSGLAVLTRLPVGAVTSHRHRRFPDVSGKHRRFSRDLLCVEILPRSGKSFEVWIVHLKSKRGGAAETEAQRLAEASQIRRELDRRLARNPEARIVVLGDFNDTKDSRPLQRLVGTGSRALTTFWDEIPNESVTYTLSPFREMIDHILFTPAAGRSVIRRSYRIENMNLSTSGSDHNPVVVNIEN